MAEFIIEMVRRILKGSLVAVGTFLAGAPVVYLCASWTRPEVIQASVDRQTRRVAHHPIVFQVEPDDLFSRTGRLMARSIGSHEEGVSHTGIFSLDSESAVLVRVLLHCSPVAWSPVRDSVLLLCEAAPDDDTRHFTMDVVVTTESWRNRLGCRWCSFQSWRAKGDAVVFDCVNGHTQMFGASGSERVPLASGDPNP
jgi:hypothetical protein